MGEWEGRREGGTVEGKEEVGMEDSGREMSSEREMGVRNRRRIRKKVRVDDRGRNVREKREEVILKEKRYFMEEGRMD